MHLLFIISEQAPGNDWIIREALCDQRGRKASLVSE